MSKKQLIISLIKDDLTNIRLVSGLSKLGLDSGNDYLHLSQTFFTLMGFKENAQTDKLHKEYFKHAKKVVSIDIAKHPKELTEMATKIFDNLIAEKERSQIKK